MTTQRLHEASTHAASSNGAAKAELGEFGFFIDGQSIIRKMPSQEVRSPYDDALVADCPPCRAKQCRNGDRAVRRGIRGDARCRAGNEARCCWKRSAPDRRRRDEFAHTIALEAGKPIRTARAAKWTERPLPSRWPPKRHGVSTGRSSAGLVAGNDGRVGQIRHIPRRPVVGISPFNSPLNLVAHKVAPCLGRQAAQSSCGQRPQTPVSSFKLAQPGRSKRAGPRPASPSSPARPKTPMPWSRTTAASWRPYR